MTEFRNYLCPVGKCVFKILDDKVVHVMCEYCKSLRQPSA